jgi:ribonuclease Z
MQVTFLGTSGAVPTTQRNTSAVMITVSPHNRKADQLLFDCGEGTQRQMMRFETGFSISHVFLTHLHGDHVLGLSGLCQTLDFNDREQPLSIHTPPGTKRAVKDLVGVTGAQPDYPISVNEVSPGGIAVQGGGYEVRAFETDHRTQSVGYAVDEDETIFVETEVDSEIAAFAAEHYEKTVGYAVVEDERKGRFDKEKAEKLGIPEGPKFSKLHEGEPVKLEDEDGTVIEPEQVVGDPRPGRRVVYTGDTRPTDTTEEAASDADLLIHEATFADDRAERAGKTAHTTARQAAELANRAGVKRLALTHISSRYAGDASQLEQEAREVTEGEAFVAEDGQSVEIPYPEG